MKDDKRKKIINKIFWKLFLILLVGFTAIYISEATGYYEFEQHNKKVLTDDNIKLFEKDLKEGKDIDINTYADNKEIDYQNSISKMGLKMSKSMENIVVGGLESTFNFLNKIMG